MPRRRTLAAMDRDAAALALYCQGKTYRQISQELGWKSVKSSYEGVKRALADRQRDKLEQVDHFAAAVERIQTALQRCQEIIDGRHFLAAPGGKLVMDPRTGEPCLDSAPKQRAITEMRHLNDQLIMLMDLKPATKQRVEIVPQSVVDKEIEQLSKEMADGGAAPGPGVLREP
jgi:hypothetical protein